MVFYFVTDHYKRGGIENIHQYCHYFNLLGYESYIVYFPFHETYDVPLYIEEYESIRMCSFDDMIRNASQDDIMFLPEVVNIRDFKALMDSINERAKRWEPAMQIGMMWLSLDHGIDVWKSINMHETWMKYHIFQSNYALETIRNDFHDNQQYFLISDVTQKQCIDMIPLQHEFVKEDIIAYNPAKDKITPQICSELGIKSLPLENMTSLQVRDSLKRCKVYVDLGNHPGKDRMPREAACMGCVVITNKKGSAAYWDDVPIEEKVDTNDECSNLIRKVIANYDEYRIKQQAYIQMIAREEESIKKAIQHMIKTISV